MDLRKISVLVLCGLMAYDSAMALPTLRTGAIRSGQTTKSSSATSKYRASIVKPTGPSGTGTGVITNHSGKVPNVNSNPSASIEKFTKLIEEQQKVIDELKTKIEAKEEVIGKIEKQLIDYDEIKDKVNNGLSVDISEAQKAAVSEAIEEVKKSFVSKDSLPSGTIMTANNYKNILQSTMTANDMERLINKSTTYASLPTRILANTNSIQQEATNRENAIDELSEVYAPKTLADTVTTVQGQVRTINTTVNTTVNQVNAMNRCDYNSVPTCGDNGYTGGYIPIGGTGLIITPTTGSSTGTVTTFPEAVIP